MIDKIIDRLIELQIKIGLENNKLIIYGNLDLVPPDLLLDIQNKKKEIKNFSFFYV